MWAICAVLNALTQTKTAQWHIGPHVNHKEYGLIVILARKINNALIFPILITNRVGLLHSTCSLE